MTVLVSREEEVTRREREPERYVKRTVVSGARKRPVNLLIK